MVGPCRSYFKQSKCNKIDLNDIIVAIPYMDAVYTPSRLLKKLTISIQHVQKDMTPVLQDILKKMEGQCCEEGFVEPDSVQIDSYSAGTIQGSSIIFDVIIQCNLAYPSAGQLYEAKVENITKAGVKCRLDRSVSPFVIFIARDHHYKSDYFSTVKENGKLLLEHKINLNENQNGMFVNLSQLSEDILNKIVAFMNYADAQEMTLNTVEHTKDGLKDIYFNNYND